VTAYCLMIGIIETGVCLLAFFLVLDDYGITASSLPFSADDHYQSGAPDLNINGHIFDESEQLFVLSHAQSAYWSVIVCTQFWHVWFCKTRFVPLLSHGIFNNMQLNYGVIIELAIMLVVIYVPGSQPFFGTSGFPGKFWAIQFVSFGILLLASEPRKIWARNHPEGWVAHHLLW